MWTWTVLCSNEGKAERLAFNDGLLPVFEALVSSNCPDDLMVHMYVFDLTFYGMYSGKYQHRVYSNGKIQHQSVVEEPSWLSALRKVIRTRADGFIFSGHGSGFTLGSSYGIKKQAWSPRLLGSMLKTKFKVVIMDNCKSMNLGMLMEFEPITTYLVASPLGVSWISYLECASLMNPDTRGLLPWLRKLGREFVSLSSAKDPMAVTVVDTRMVPSLWRCLLESGLFAHLTFTKRTREPGRNTDLHDLDKVLEVTARRHPDLKRLLRSTRLCLSKLVVAKIYNTTARRRRISPITVYSARPPWIPKSVACETRLFQITKPGQCPTSNVSQM